MKPTRTWILLANGGEARILLNEGLNDGVHEISGMEFKNEHPALREVMADKPGRSFDRVGGGRHAMEYSSDITQEAEQQFAKLLAETLHSGFRAGKFDRLSVTASPSMLAQLRKALPGDVAKSVHSEIDKDYTKIAKNKIADLLRKAGAIG